MPGALRFASAALPVLIAGCGPPSPPAAHPPTAPPRGPVPIRISADPWVLATEGWGNDHRGAYLSNGYLGQRYGQSGTGLSASSPEPAYMAGLYAPHEALETLPSLTPLEIRAGARVFGTDPSHIRKYHQELRLRHALLVTRATWDTGGGEADIELEAALLRSEPAVAVLKASVVNRSRTPVELKLTPSSPHAKTTYSTTLMPLDGGGAGSAIVPAGAAARFAVVTRVTGAPRSVPEDNSASGVSAAGVEQSLAAHRQAWDVLWRRDIEIEGDAEAQQVVRACLFYLLASTREDQFVGVPPMGLSSAAFNGHVFWDMDSWMLPALLPQRPEIARAMLEYRFRTLDGARANAKREGLPGAAYAWESARTGRETILGQVFEHGRHVSGDVALAMGQYYRATGDRAWLRTRAWPVLEATAENWAARAKPDGKGGFVIRGVTTPDENAGRVDHSAWTHHVARVNLELAAQAASELGRPVNPKWLKVARGLTLLRSPDGMILSYAGFNEKKKSKQADALLLDHPGEANLSPAELGRLYDFYAPRVIANGPAMTDAIHAIIAARLDRPEEAMKRFRQSYQPFVRPPYHLFSEKRSRDNVCFLTGAAGVVEAVLYGFGGLRLESDPARPHRPLLTPHLPEAWTALRIRGLQWRGKGWDVEIRPGAPPAWTPR